MAPLLMERMPLADMPRRAVRRAMLGVAMLAFRLRLATARPKRAVHGIRLVFFGTRIDATLVERRLGDALTLLAQKAPAMYRRCRRRIGHLAAWDELDWFTNRCGGVMVGTTVQWWSPAESAAVLVHESTHLQFDALGVRATPALRPRIEAVCSREADEVRNLLNSEAGDTLGSVKRMSAAEISAYRSEQATEVTRELGLPDWVGRLVHWVRDGSTRRTRTGR